MGGDQQQQHHQRNRGRNPSPGSSGGASSSSSVTPDGHQPQQHHRSQGRGRFRSNRGGKQPRNTDDGSSFAAESVEDFVELLQQQGLGKYAPTFSRERISRSLCRRLNESHLQSIGVQALGDRIKIMDLANKGARPDPPSQPNHDRASVHIKTYRPFSSDSSICFWLDKQLQSIRSESSPQHHNEDGKAQQAQQQGGAYNGVLKFASWMDPIEDIVSRNALSIKAVEKLFSLLADPTLTDNIVRQTTNKIYACLLESRVLRDLSGALLQIPHLPDKNQAFSFIVNIMTVLDQLLSRIESSYSQFSIDTLRRSFDMLLISTSDSLGAEPTLVENSFRLLSRLTERQDYLAKLHLNRAQKLTMSEGETDFSMFRQIGIFPTSMEMTSRVKPILQKNITKGFYPSVDQYLSTHFHLLREDLIAPLREGIAAYLSGDERPDIQIYTNVQVIGVSCNRSGISAQVAFQPTTKRLIKWASSKRLLYGSLVCLSADDFKTFTWGTVSNRNLELLTKKNAIEIKFPFDPEEMLFSRRTYVMVESPSYFEAYRYTLQALQQHDDNTLPFQEYLLRLKQKPERTPIFPIHQEFNFERVFGPGIQSSFHPTSVPAFVEWPAVGTLDFSQSRAAQAALTQEISLIQGPPGTGKSFLGLKVAQLMLNTLPQNSPPILVVCFTNHALDQFLLGISQFESSIVRVGSRSKCQELDRFNLKELSRQKDSLGNKNRGRMFYELKQLEPIISQLQSQFNADALRASLIEQVAPQHFQAILSSNQHKGLSIHDLFRIWLNGENGQIPGSAASGHPQAQVQSGQNQRLDRIDEYLDEEEVEDEEEIQRIQQERLLIDDFDDIEWDNLKRENENPNEKEFREFLTRFRFPSVQERLEDIPFDDALFARQDVWNMTHQERMCLYKMWFKLSKEPILTRLQELCKEYDSTCKEIDELDKLSFVEVMRTARVVGMTTTGVSKYCDIVRNLKPQIVIVEEAAEVLEAHIITALSHHTRHLILIGDHQQLRPATAVYRLSVKYALDVSLFERLVSNGVYHVTLQEQRRMRPEISKMIKPIYPNLVDHESVTKYDNVRGVGKNVFFVNHSVSERQDRDESSKSNPHEAEFIIRLCNYIIQQGYSPSSVTILTMYAGQILALKKLIKGRPQEDPLQLVRVTTVDNFQGEENDIILLSLVRSNADSNIGFLKISNRVNVALSRAKMGFYLIGNARVLEAGSDDGLWKNIFDYLRDQGLIGQELELCCQNHPMARTMVKDARDFNVVPDGGCSLPCTTRLDCGHQCPRACHIGNHDTVRCMKPCDKQLPCGHQCSKECFEECGPCTKKVPKLMPNCQHVQVMQCQMDPRKVKCQFKVTKIYDPCGHSVTIPCCQPFYPECQKQVWEILPCGHKAKIKCSSNREAAARKCSEPCGASLPCGHICRGKCKECKGGTQHKPCVRTCDRDLFCGHKCSTAHRCSEKCSLCSLKCENKCAHSKCSKKCGELCAPCAEPCAWQCPHLKCSRRCWEPCDRPRCNAPCDATLPCGHPCLGMCGEPHPDVCRICKPEYTDSITLERLDEMTGDPRFIALQDCGHIFEVTSFDEYVATAAESAQLKLLNCPDCRTPIRLTMRYFDITKQKWNDLENVKRRLLREITMNELRQVGQAMRPEGAAGHWYKCPNGHLYFVGECGGPMQTASCPECGAVVGGSNHQSAENNQRALEMEQLLLDAPNQ